MGWLIEILDLLKWPGMALVLAMLLGLLGMLVFKESRDRNTRGGGRRG